MKDIKIRSLNESDLEVYCDLCSELNKSQGMKEFSRPAPNSLKESIFEVDTLVAEKNDILVGFISGFKHFNPHNGFWRYIIASLFVLESERKQGIGSDLIRTVILDKSNKSEYSGACFLIVLPIRQTS